MTELKSVLSEGHKFQALDVLSGVPQGTVLVPLLFLAHVKGLPQATNSDARLFADGCLVYGKIRNQKYTTAP